MKKIHPKRAMKTLPCLLGKWKKCFTRKEDKATSEKEDLKEDLKRTRRRWVQEASPSHCGLPFTSSHNLQERVKKKKAMVATWDDSKMKSEEEIDASHVCFMANGGETSKVNLETSLEEMI